MDENSKSAGDNGLKHERIKLITCIVDRGVGKRVMKLCKEVGISSAVLMLGRGTADSEMLTMLGLGENEKDVVMLTIAESKSADVLERITTGLHLDEPGGGIAFSIPLSAVASQYDSYLSVLGGVSVPNKQSKGANHDKI